MRFAEALLEGMPADGGLYVPESVPKWRRRAVADFADLAFDLARPFTAPDIPDAPLRRIVRSAYDFPVPVVPVGPAHVLELFHGPTLSFKDFGARFMARAMEYLLARTRRRATILVATSGDTGSAVSHGFHGMKNLRVVVLFPRGRVSPFQRRQLTCLGGNVVPVEVAGDFDACQALAKRALADPALRRIGLTSANSISVGRLIPQTFYYVWAALKLGGRPSVCVPSGNFGNVTAALMAREMGAPFARVLAATNANDSVPRYLASGRFEPKATRATLSNAMDVGKPSNFERIVRRYRDVGRVLEAVRVTDAETQATMRRVWKRHRYLLDPHTAVGWKATERAGGEGWVVAATASPAKFPELVRKVVGVRAVPPALPRRDFSHEMEIDYAALRKLLARC